MHEEVIRSERGDISSDWSTRMLLFLASVSEILQISCMPFKESCPCLLQAYHSLAMSYAHSPAELYMCTFFSKDSRCKQSVEADIFSFSPPKGQPMQHHSPRNARGVTACDMLSVGPSSLTMVGS